MLGADEGERLVFGDVTILVRAARDTTGGSFTIFEEVPPLADTPLHVHANEDELFYPLEGEHIYQVGTEEFRIGPGGMVFAPRGIPHSQRRVVPGEGRQLVLTHPPASRDSSASWPLRTTRERSGRRLTRRLPRTTGSVGSESAVRSQPLSERRDDRGG